MKVYRLGYALCRFTVEFVRANPTLGAAEALPVVSPALDLDFK